MFLPLLLILLSTIAAGVVAYGTHHAWAQYPHGIEFILMVRRLEWPIAALSVILCLIVIGLVIAGKRRAWWLLGLGPVLGLLLYHLYRDPYRGLAVLDNPTFVSAAEATSVADDDYVVGLTFAGQPYAYPYNHLYLAPVIVQQDQRDRMLLIWSAYANRAAAWKIGHDLHASDIEIVSMPANAMVIYNTRLGQFINGVSGTTSKGEKPAGLGEPIDVQKMPWGRWRKLHPNTRVLIFSDPDLAKLLKEIPSAPLEPKLPMPHLASTRPADARVLVIATTRPVAMPTGAIRAADPVLNIKVDQVPIVLFRNPKTGQFVAFDRHVERDMIPRFERNLDRARPADAYLVDTDNLIGWSADGRALEGELKGRQLKAIPVQEGLYWGVMKFWMPQLEWLDPP